MGNTGKVDRGLSEAARKKYIKEQKQLEKRIGYIVNALKTGGPQDPSEVKKKNPKRTMVSQAYKRAKKADPSGRISDRDIAYQKAKQAKRKRK